MGCLTSVKLQLSGLYMDTMTMSCSCVSMLVCVSKIILIFSTSRIFPVLLTGCFCTLEAEWWPRFIYQHQAEPLATQERCMWERDMIKLNLKICRNKSTKTGWCNEVGWSYYCSHPQIEFSPIATCKWLHCVISSCIKQWPTVLDTHLTMWKIGKFLLY